MNCSDNIRGVLTKFTNTLTPSIGAVYRSEYPKYSRNLENSILKNIAKPGYHGGTSIPDFQQEMRSQRHLGQVFVGTTRLAESEIYYHF